MIDPTPIETIAALVLFIAFGGFVIVVVLGLWEKIQRLLRRHDNPYAEIDARTLMVENLHYRSGDPTAPSDDSNAEVRVGRKAARPSYVSVRPPRRVRSRLNWGRYFLR